MYVAIMAPANRPVKRANRAVLEKCKISDICRKEMTASARNATPTPAMPGTVAAYRTEGGGPSPPRTPATRPPPNSPPMNCAAPHEDFHASGHPRIFANRQSVDAPICLNKPVGPARSKTPKERFRCRFFGADLSVLGLQGKSITGATSQSREVFTHRE